MSTTESNPRTATRTLVGALHLTAYALIASTALRVLMNIATALDDAPYEQYGLDIDELQRVASNIAEMTTTIPAVLGVALLAFLRHVGASKETPGFFVAMAVAGGMGALLALAGIYDIVRLVTDSFAEALMPPSNVSKVALGFNWLTTVLLGAALVNLAWMLWTGTDGDAESVADEDDLDPSKDSDHTPTEVAHVNDDAAPEANDAGADAPTLAKRDPSAT